jgi:hypothetical protein
VDTLVQEIYLQAAKVMLGGYAAFAFVVAFFNKSRGAVVWGVGLVVGALLLGSGCASYSPAKKWDAGVARMPSGRNSCGQDALAKYLELTQNVHMTQTDVVDMYEEARKVDKLPDEEEGTNLHGLQKAAGLTNRVTLTASEQVIDALQASVVLLRLPAYTGHAIWWNTQYWPNDGLYMGDHLIVCIGYKGGLFKLMNNEGPCWGSNGCVWLWEEHLDGWLEDGEASAWLVW